MNMEKKMAAASEPGRRPDSVENPKESAGKAKLQLQLNPPAAKREMALALESGAAKYGEWNWRDAGIQLTTYVGALQRHLDAIAAGEDVDPDSGLSHWAHILAGAAIVVDAEEFEMLADDRPSAREPGKTGGFDAGDYARRHRECFAPFDGRGYPPSKLAESDVSEYLKKKQYDPLKPSVGGMSPNKDPKPPSPTKPWYST